MDTPRHKQGEIYDNEEDRHNGLLAAKRRYGSNPWQCETCNVTILRGNKTNHLKSKKHSKQIK